MSNHRDISIAEAPQLHDGPMLFAVDIQRRLPASPATAYRVMADGTVPVCCFGGKGGAGCWRACHVLKLNDGMRSTHPATRRARGELMPRAIQASKGSKQPYLCAVRLPGGGRKWVSAKPKRDTEAIVEQRLLRI